MQTLTPEQLQKLILDFVADCLQQRESHVMSNPVSEEVWFAELDHLQMTKAEEAQELATRDFSRISRVADAVLASAGIALTSGTEVHRKLCMELLKASKLLSEVWIERHQGDYTRTNSQVVAEAMKMVDGPGATVLPQAIFTPQGQPSAEKNLLTKVISEYTTEQLSAGEWTDKSKRAFLAHCNMFFDYTGQAIMVEDINAKLMREYKAALQKIPTHRNKLPQFVGKSFAELLSMYDNGLVENPLGISTINKYLNRMSTLLAYAKRNGYILTNPAEDMQLKQPKLDEEFRDAFTLEDLRKLFHSPQHTSDTLAHPYQFWVPLLALFTGARQGEIAQLYLEDLRREDGVWVFDINGKLDKKVKTKTSARLVPIHPFLLDLGLVTYAQELRDKGEVRLFPELPRKEDGYGVNVSRWFNGRGHGPGFRQQCQIQAAPGEPGKVFHSFRHTLITLLASKRVDSELVHRLDGHKMGSMTLGRYTKGKSLVHAMLEEAVSVIDFHLTIPLDHLKASKYARMKE